MPPIVNRDKCLKCSLCAQICCMNVFGPAQTGEYPQVRYPEECWHCRACVMDCPAGAIDLRYPLPMMMLSRTSPRYLARKEGETK